MINFDSPKYLGQYFSKHMHISNVCLEDTLEGSVRDTMVKYTLFEVEAHSAFYDMKIC